MAWISDRNMDLAFGIVQHTFLSDLPWHDSFVSEFSGMTLFVPAVLDAISCWFVLFRQDLFVSCGVKEISS